MNASFYNGVEGIKTQNFGIDVTANNIANVNTPGFKYSDAEFKDVFYKIVNSQSSNPSQAGFGSTAAASRIVFEQGSPVATGGEFDVALEGKGFFGVLGADGNAYYTRNGSFVRDVNGNLVDNSGNYVLGTMNPAFTSITFNDRISSIFGKYTNSTPVTSGFTITSNNDFNIGTTASQGIMSVPKNIYMPAQPTQNVKWSGNLDSGIETKIVEVDLNTQNLNLQQSPDGKYTVSGNVNQADIFSAKPGDRVLLNFKDDDGNQTSFEATLDDNLNFTSNELDLQGFDEASLKLDSAQVVTEQEAADNQVLESSLYNADGTQSTLRLTLERVLPQVGDTTEYRQTAQIYNSQGEAVGNAVNGTLIFDKNGALVQNGIASIANPQGGTINIDLGTPYDPNKPGSGFSGIYIREDAKKGISSQSDGYAEGFFSQYDIASDGSILISFTNGKTSTAGKLALYNFINEQGLAAVGDNIFAATANSGEASFITNNGKVVNTAKFQGGYLEQSNADLSNELTNLIVMQKAFDASSKSITTSDQMIQKAINMKK